MGRAKRALLLVYHNMTVTSMRYMQVGYSFLIKTLREKFSDYHFPWILMLNDKSIPTIVTSISEQGVSIPLHSQNNWQTQIETQQSLESVQTQESLETWHKSESVETNTFTYTHSQLMQAGHRIASLDSGAKGGVKGASHIPLTALCEKYFLFMHIWDKC